MKDGTKDRGDSKEDPGTARGGFAPPAVTLPKGGGAIRGIGEKFAANPVTGTGSLSVPITTSPGRYGFGPALSLSYDSGAGNGPFGFGWSLSIPSITRKTEKGLPQYLDAEESDVYILSGSEDLVPVYRQDLDGTWVRRNQGFTRDEESGWVRDRSGNLVIHDDDRDGYKVRRYRPRVEGLFARIERWRHGETGEIHWRSISKDNITTLYGKDNSSRVFDPDEKQNSVGLADPDDPSSVRPKRIFSWLICQSYDDKGNALLYEYAAENDEGVDRKLANERNRVHDANRYLKRIKYGNKTPNRDQATWEANDPAKLPNDNWMFEVVFDYGDAQYEDLALDAPRPAAEQHRFVRASSLPALPSDTRERGWKVRPDPFSSYRSGFEVRTYRLCRRVLMFHHFPDEADVKKDCLVRSTDFTYSFEGGFESEPRKDRSAIYTFLEQVTHSGYRREGDRYLKRSLPPVEFGYSKPVLNERVEEVDAGSLENLPAGLDGSAYQWTDLHGEGIPGILLTEQACAWFYKSNWSPLPQKLNGGAEVVKARFSALETVALKPNLSLSAGADFMDLAGDGQPDLVMLDGPTPGFFEHDDGESWKPFRPFVSALGRDMRDPNLKFVDLDGDGHADVLVTEDDAFVWHPSLAEDGFGAARRVAKTLDEEKGPRVVFADGTQSIHLADLSGDGLTDIVRIRNSEVCYWPNLGYGRFGAKVTMDWTAGEHDLRSFDRPEDFDPALIRLADIDGSGTTDIIYLHRDGVRLYFNQSGNSWSTPEILKVFPRVDELVSITPLDLLGHGMACLVWSSQLPSDSARPMRYVNLMGAGKPHLLNRTSNNLGAETYIEYAPSTKFYLQDKQDGRTWISRLPFPVHVVEKVVTHDHVSRNRFVTRYAYHHGYFDGEEREFRGFGMVEQWDTEEFGSIKELEIDIEITNESAASHVPPVFTRTWFHTGAFTSHFRVADSFAREYYREPGLSDAEIKELLLRETNPRSSTKLTLDDEREARRALKGSMLRQEVYALDGKGVTDLYPNGHPYTVVEQNFSIDVVQSRSGNRHGVFFTHPCEAVTYQFERDPKDPRVRHEVTIDVDRFGSVLRSLAIAYRRRALPDVEAPEQLQTHLIFTVNRFANRDSDADSYRIGLPVETRTFEIVKPPEPTLTNTRVNLFRFGEMEILTKTLFPLEENHPDEAKLWPDEKWDWRRLPADAPNGTRLRLVEHMRTLYREDDLSGPSELGQAGPIALPFENYKLALTPDLAKKIFVDSGKLTAAALDTVLSVECGYVHSEGDNNWWIPSGRVFYSPNGTDSPEQELEYARQHFFVPHRYRDPFHTDIFKTETFVEFDEHDLLITEFRDALQNIATVEYDYRVLQPSLVTDPNGNRVQAAYDTLGIVVASALKGKENNEGDTLDDFESDLTESQITEFYEADDPHALAADLLAGATTRIIYDLDRFRHTQPAQPGDRKKWLPAYAATLARETHVCDPLPPQGLKIQISFTYSDGFGREIQKKIQAEPGPLTEGGQAVSGRWVGSGWTIFNNKGQPVRQYEPFFSQLSGKRHQYEFSFKAGVSTIQFYDPVGRAVASLHPDHTWSKTIFDPWQKATWDVNDTAALLPNADEDVKGFLLHHDGTHRLPPSDYLPTWHQLRTDPEYSVKFAERFPNPEDRKCQTSAAVKAAAHANTPTVVHFDTLARPFLMLAHNGFEVDQTPIQFPTRVYLDVEGKLREVRDANTTPTEPLGRLTMTYDYDMAGRSIHQANMEAGNRWMLNDVGGKAVAAWDGRGHQFRHEYDELRRHTASHIKGFDPDDQNREIQNEKVLYGDTLNNGLTDVQKVQLNLRGKVYKYHDTAGLINNMGRNPATGKDEAFDFKGNLLRSVRQLTANFKEAPDWGTGVVLELGLETFTGSTSYDALNRVKQILPPHSNKPGTKINVIQPAFNEANLLEGVDVWLGRAAEPDAHLDPIAEGSSAVGITNIDYDAKGQRISIEYTNSVRTKYGYDPETYRLTHLETLRGNEHLQDLKYAHDAIGNITSIRDDAQQTIIFRNQIVEPQNEYVYDAIYRLTEATGREHLGQAGIQVPHSYNDAGRVRVPSGDAAGLFSPLDGTAMGRYCEKYVYDAVGNFLEMSHHRTCSGVPSWRRTYTYNEPSSLEPSRMNNRLTSTALGGATETYSAGGDGYDAHGNMLRMPQLQKMTWDYRDQLQMSQRQKVNNEDEEGAERNGERTWYVYDSSGRRVRKVTELPNNAGIKDERVYLGAFEVFRSYEGAAAARTLKLERETLHVMDDKQRIAQVETRTFGNEQNVPRRSIRYQFGNHVGSTILELDDQAQIISYEEYSPYGSTTYQGVRAITETPKRYRYSRTERDEETGLMYQRQRYYAPWLGRWISSDPINISGGLNLYEYAGSCPTCFVDPSGLSPEHPEDSDIHQVWHEGEPTEDYDKQASMAGVPPGGAAGGGLPGSGTPGSQPPGSDPPGSEPPPSSEPESGDPADDDPSQRGDRYRRGQGENRQRSLAEERRRLRGNPKPPEDLVEEHDPNEWEKGEKPKGGIHSGDKTDQNAANERKPGANREKEALPKPDAQNAPQNQPKPVRPQRPTPLLPPKQDVPKPDPAPLPPATAPPPGPVPQQPVLPRPNNPSGMTPEQLRRSEERDRPLEQGATDWAAMLTLGFLATRPLFFGAAGAGAGGAAGPVRIIVFALAR